MRCRMPLGLIPACLILSAGCSEPNPYLQDGAAAGDTPSEILLFLGGDVMTARGIDQILPCPGDPAIYESYAEDALHYVRIAERVNGTIPAPVGFEYIWGDALAEWQALSPDVRIVNLETSITTNDRYWPGKSIQYRMNPENIGCLTAAGFNFCSLANNHVLDWDYPGLVETMQSLRSAGIAFSGAGIHREEAGTPAVIDTGQGRVIVFAIGADDCGIPVEWRALRRRPGVNRVLGLSAVVVERIGDAVRELKRAGDVVVVSVHWGGNWGYDVPSEHREFARELIDLAGVDIVHGHSSHHARPLEVYRGKLILYGCGDLINDYEGIGRYDEYLLAHFAFLYFPRVDARTGMLKELTITPMRIACFRLNAVSREEAEEIVSELERAYEGVEVSLTDDLRLSVRWQ